MIQLSLDTFRCVGGDGRRDTTIDVYVAVCGWVDPDEYIYLLLIVSVSASFLDCLIFKVDRGKAVTSEISHYLPYYREFQRSV